MKKLLTITLALCAVIVAMACGSNDPDVDGVTGATEQNGESGAGLIISSQAAYMYPIPNDIELQLVNTPTAQLKDVKFIQEVAMQNSGFAYMIAKRMNHLQAQRAAATSWRKRRARINTISPGVIVTPAGLRRVQCQW